jgi:hypothetical protein
VGALRPLSTEESSGPKSRGLEVFVAGIKVVTFTLSSASKGEVERSMTVDVHFKGELSAGVVLAALAQSVVELAPKVVKGEVVDVVVAR